RLTIKAIAAEVGNVETSIPIQLEGEAGWIGFNSKYLLDYLKGREGVMVLELNDPSNPGTFIHRGEKVVVMPMFVKGDDSGTPPTPAEQPAVTAEAPADPQAEEAAEAPPAAEGEAPSDVEQDEGSPPPEQSATEGKPKRSRKRKAKTTE
ncbi:MAG: hypothetical protein Q8P22_11115, partial [Chloroflexota bacterium]|nr:hypothetical protein [Chloroflexota bacterium]